MSRLGLILVFLLLQASAAHAQSIPMLNVSQFGAICDGKSHPLTQRFSALSAAQAVYPFVTSLGQEIDYASLKLASNRAFGPDGAEHGTSNPQANIPLYIPQGVCYLGKDTWIIRAADGIRIEGASAMATKIVANGIVLAFDGLWYSQIGNLNITTLSSSATVALDIDGNVPGHPYNTFGVQANNFTNIFVDGGGSQYGLALCRQGSGGGQCSENIFINPHLVHASEAVYFQNGFNAIDNVIVGGDIQNYTKDAIKLIAGSVKIVGMSFESTTGYTQIANGGCDITANAAGTDESIIVSGSRSESLCVYNGQWSQVAILEGVRQQPAAFIRWARGTSYAFNTVTSQRGADGLQHMYRVTTPGTSGAAKPTWPANGTVTDGSVVWTMTNYNSVTVHEGHLDMRTSFMDPTSTIFEGSIPFGNAVNCGSNPTLDDGTTRYSGTVTEGTGATGCTINLRFWHQQPAPRCVVTSPTGNIITKYSVDRDPTHEWVLNIVNSPSVKNGDNRYTWICQQ